MSFGELVYDYFWWILGSFFLLSFTGLLIFARYQMKKRRYRLIVRIRESESKLSQYFSSIKNDVFKRKVVNANGKRVEESYFIHPSAYYETIFKSRATPTIDFIKGIELPVMVWKRNAELGLKFMGTQAFDKAFEEKMIVELAEMGKDNNMTLKTIIIGVIVLAVIGVVIYMMATGKKLF